MIGNIVKIRCRNCGMVKRTVLDIDIGNYDPLILEHWDRISKCCEKPEYRWYPEKSFFVDVMNSGFGEELGKSLGNSFPLVVESLTKQVGRKKMEEIISEIFK